MNTFKHMIKSSWVVALSFCGCFSAGAGTFVDNFSAGLNPAYWTAFESSTGSFSVDASQGDVRFTKVGPNRTGGMDQIGMSLNLANLGGPVAGDFSAQLEFRNAQIPGPGLDQVELATGYANGSIFFNVRDNSNGNNAHVWTGSIQGNLPTTALDGTFRITRSGGIVSGYLNDALIYSTGNASALTAVNFTLNNNLGSNDATSVAFDNFRLEAASIPEPSTAALLALGGLALAGRRKCRASGNA